MLSKHQLDRMNEDTDEVKHMRLNYQTLLRPDIDEFYNVLTKWQQSRFDKAKQKMKGVGFDLSQEQQHKIRNFTPSSNIIQTDKIKDVKRNKAESSIDKFGEEMTTDNMKILAKTIYEKFILPRMKYKKPYGNWMQFYIIAQLAKHRDVLKQVESINNLSEKQVSNLFDILNPHPSSQKGRRHAGSGWLTNAWDSFKKVVSNIVNTTVHTIGDIVSGTFKKIEQKFDWKKGLLLIGKIVLGVVTDNPAMLEDVGKEILDDLSDTVLQSTKEAIKKNISGTVGEVLGDVVGNAQNVVNAVDKAGEVLKFLE